MITLKLLAWVVVIIAFVAWDYYEIVKKKTRPNYLLENIIKGVLFILYGVYIFDTQNDLRTVALVVYALTSYWIMFDLLLNSVRHLDPFYIGKTSGWIDRFAHINSTTFVAYWVAKGLAAYGFVSSIIYLYRHG